MPARSTANDVLQLWKVTLAVGRLANFMKHTCACQHGQSTAAAYNTGDEVSSKMGKTGPCQPTAALPCCSTCYCVDCSACCSPAACMCGPVHCRLAPEPLSCVVTWALLPVPVLIVAGPSAPRMLQHVIPVLTARAAQLNPFPSPLHSLHCCVMRQSPCLTCRTMLCAVAGTRTD